MSLLVLLEASGRERRCLSYAWGVVLWLSLDVGSACAESIGRSLTSAIVSLAEDSNAREVSDNVVASILSANGLIGHNDRDLWLYLVTTLIIGAGAFLLYSLRINRRLNRAVGKANAAALALQAQRDNNRALLLAAGDGIHVLDLRGNVVLANDAFCRMLGYQPEQVTQLNVAHWDVKWSAEELIRNIPTLRGLISTFETRHRRQDGEVIDVEINTVGVDVDGIPLLFCSARDITARKYAENQLLQAASVFNHARESIMIIDPVGAIVDANDAFTRVTGFSREEVIGQCPPLLNVDHYTPEFCLLIKDALQCSGYWSGETWNRRKSGELYATHLTISRVPNTSGEPQSHVGIFTDITPLIDHQKHLEQIAHYDPLTFLPNRVLLADRLQHALAQTLRRNEMVAVVYVDLDGFKAVNDTYGHNVGDELLVGLSQRMKAALRDGDTLARIGGDEFIAVLVDLVSVEKCERVLERLLKAAAAPLLVGGRDINVSASIGVALYPQHANDADSLLLYADNAMYKAKQAGKNRYVFFDAGHLPTV